MVSMNKCCHSGDTHSGPHNNDDVSTQPWNENSFLFINPCVLFGLQICLNKTKQKNPKEVSDICLVCTGARRITVTKSKGRWSTACLNLSPQTILSCFFIVSHCMILYRASLVPGITLVIIYSFSVTTLLWLGLWYCRSGVYPGNMMWNGKWENTLYGTPVRHRGPFIHTFTP